MDDQSSHSSPSQASASARDDNQPGDNYLGDYTTAGDDQAQANDSQPTQNQPEEPTQIPQELPRASADGNTTPKDDPLADQFCELMANLVTVVEGAQKLVTIDHNTYGNLEFLARACRNLGFFLVWASLSEDNASKLAIPLGLLLQHTSTTASILSYMIGHHTDFMFSARKQLAKLEDELGVIEGAYMQLHTRISNLGPTSLKEAEESVLAAHPNTCEGLVDMEGGVEEQNAIQRFAQLVADVCLFSSIVAPTKPTQHSSAAQSPAKPAQPQLDSQPQPQSDKPRVEPDNNTAKVTLPQQQPPTARKASLVEIVGGAVRDPLSLLTSRSQDYSMHEDADFPEVHIARNCVAILRACHTLVAHDYEVYGNLEFMARVTYNLAAPLLCVRPSDVALHGQLEEPLASVLATTTQASKHIVDMAERRANMFSFARYNLTSLEKVFFKLELLSENMHTTFMHDGELEIRIGSARVRVVNLDDPLVKDGAAERIARMLADMEVVCRVVSKRRMAQAVGDSDDDENDDTHGGSSNRQDQDLGDSDDDDDFVDVASIIRSEDGELVSSYVDPFSENKSNRWYFLSYPRMRDAITRPLSSSLHVTLRSMHDSVKFVHFHLTRVLPASTPEQDAEGPRMFLEITNRRIVDTMSQLAAVQNHVVVIAGPAQSGKAALINAMLGHAAIPVSARTCAQKRIPIVVRYNSFPQVTAFAQNARPIRLAESRLQAWLEEEEILAAQSQSSAMPKPPTQWTHLEIAIPHHLLQLGLTFVKLPHGSDLSVTHKQIRNLLTQAAVGVVTVACNAVEGPELPSDCRLAFEHLKLDFGLQDVCFAVTKMDLVRRNERAAFKKDFNSKVSVVHQAVQAKGKTISSLSAAASEAMSNTLYPAAKYANRSYEDEREPTNSQEPGGNLSDNLLAAGTNAMLGVLTFGAFSTDDGTDPAPLNANATGVDTTEEKSAERPYCVFASATWALGERVAGGMATSRRGRTIPCPDKVADLEKFNESAVGKLEMWISRALLVRWFGAEFVKHRVVELLWATALLSFCQKIQSDVQVTLAGDDQLRFKFESARPELEVARLRANAMFNLVGSRVKSLRGAMSSQVLNDLENLAVKFEKRMQVSPNNPASQLVLQAAAKPDDMVSAFDTTTLTTGKDPVLTAKTVSNTECIKAFFAHQWQKWGGVVCGSLCRSTANKWCPVAEELLASINNEAADVLAQQVLAQKSFVNSLGLECDTGSLISPLDLPSTAHFSAQTRARMVATVMAKFDEAGVEMWDLFVSETGDPSSTGLGGMVGAVLRGTAEWKLDQIERRVCTWVAARMPAWVRVNKMSLAGAVADAVLGEVGTAALQTKTRVEWTLDLLEWTIESSISGGKQLEQLGWEASKKALESFIKRAGWTTRSSMTSVGRYPDDLEAEAPAPEDQGFDIEFESVDVEDEATDQANGMLPPPKKKKDSQLAVAPAAITDEVAAPESPTSKRQDNTPTKDAASNNNNKESDADDEDMPALQAVDKQAAEFRSPQSVKSPPPTNQSEQLDRPAPVATRSSIDEFDDQANRHLSSYFVTLPGLPDSNSQPNLEDSASDDDNAGAQQQ